MTSLVRPAVIAATSVALLSGGIAGAAAPHLSAAAARHLPGTTCTAFPANNVWHAPVADLPVNRLSAQWVHNIGDNNLHPDFGPSYGAQSVPYGIPITYVGGS